MKNYLIFATAVQIILAFFSDSPNLLQFSFTKHKNQNSHGGTESNVSY